MKSKLIPACFLIFGIALVFFGISRGEAEFVVEKAVRICLECIGIG